MLLLQAAGSLCVPLNVLSLCCCISLTFRKDIVTFMGVCNDDSGLYIITEHVAGGDLRKWLKQKVGVNSSCCAQFFGRVQRLRSTKSQRCSALCSLVVLTKRFRFSFSKFKELSWIQRLKIALDVAVAMW